MLRYYSCPIKGHVGGTEAIVADEPPNIRALRLRLPRGTERKDVRNFLNATDTRTLLAWKPTILKEDETFHASIRDPVLGMGLDSRVGAIIPNVSLTDGRPLFKRCIVRVNAVQQVHDMIVTLPDVEEMLDGQADDIGDNHPDLGVRRRTEAVMAEAILKQRPFANVTAIKRIRMRSRLLKLREKAAIGGITPRPDKENGSLFDWLETAVKQLDERATIRGW